MGKELKSLSGYRYSTKIENHEQIASTNNMARDIGMTYGQYVAMQYTNNMPKHHIPFREQR